MARGRIDKIKDLTLYAGRIGNILYDVFALTKNIPALAILVWPELIYKVSPKFYFWAEHVLESSKLARLGRVALGLYLGTMVGITFVRLGYWGITKKAPPSVVEYPFVAVAKKAVLGAQRRISAALSGFGKSPKLH